MSDTPNPMAPLYAALAAFQGEVTDPPRSASGTVRGRQDYRYCTLDVLLQTVRPVLGRHGLAVVQTFEEIAGLRVLRTALWHKSGASITSDLPMDWDGGHQEHGSEATYLRRYGLEGILGVAATTEAPAAPAQVAA